MSGDTPRLVVPHVLWKSKFPQEIFEFYVQIFVCNHAWTVTREWSCSRAVPYLYVHIHFSDSCWSDEIYIIFKQLLFSNDWLIYNLQPSHHHKTKWLCFWQCISYMVCDDLGYFSNDKLGVTTISSSQDNMALPLTMNRAYIKCDELHTSSIVNLAMPVTEVNGAMMLINLYWLQKLHQMM